MPRRGKLFTEFKKVMGMSKKVKRFKILNEFKQFALKGNVVDLAVGVIIGSAFQGIVNSLVSDVIMPFVSLFGDMDYSNWFLILGKLPQEYDETRIHSLSYVKDTLGLPVIAYGSFLTALINFLIMAFIIFLLVKFFNRVRQWGEKLDVVDQKAVSEQPCPYCKVPISTEATRCPHCTSDLNVGPAEEGV